MNMSRRHWAEKRNKCCPSEKGEGIMAELTTQERKAKIGDIVEKVTKMTDEQLGNVHTYTSDEFEEPNHEAVALDAVIQLSKKYGKK